MIILNMQASTHKKGSFLSKMFGLEYVDHAWNQS